MDWRMMYASRQHLLSKRGTPVRITDSENAHGALLLSDPAVSNTEGPRTVSLTDTWKLRENDLTSCVPPNKSNVSLRSGGSDVPSVHGQAPELSVSSATWESTNRNDGAGTGVALDNDARAILPRHLVPWNDAPWYHGAISREEAIKLLQVCFSLYDLRFLVWD